MLLPAIKGPPARGYFALSDMNVEAPRLDATAGQRPPFLILARSCSLYTGHAHCKSIGIRWAACAPCGRDALLEFAGRERQS
ncbi:hypothetical protein SAMN05519103_04016 [Rhizobiales bacterium GAS113]|nr:hypothetical protein SAMN05519103_04016 [Rhizobiales bacterium GAS113]